MTTIRNDYCIGFENRGLGEAVPNLLCFMIPVSDLMISIVSRKRLVRKSHRIAGFVLHAKNGLATMTPVSTNRSPIDTDQCYVIIVNIWKCVVKYCRTALQLVLIIRQRIAGCLRVRLWTHLGRCRTSPGHLMELFVHNSDVSIW